MRKNQEGICVYMILDLAEFFKHLSQKNLKGTFPLIPV